MYKVVPLCHFRFHGQLCRLTRSFRRLKPYASPIRSQAIEMRRSLEVNGIVLWKK